MEQAEQPAALAVPELVTVPAKPGAQMVQAATEVLPAAKPVVEMPRGQAVQLAAPAPAYKPAAHNAQDTAPAVAE